MGNLRECKECSRVTPPNQSTVSMHSVNAALFFRFGVFNSIASLQKLIPSEPIQWPHWMKGGIRFFGSGVISREARDCKGVSEILPFLKIPLVANAHPP